MVFTLVKRYVSDCVATSAPLYNQQIENVVTFVFWQRWDKQFRLWSRHALERPHSACVGWVTRCLHCVRVHMFCMPVLELPATSVGQLKQMPFCPPKMASHTLLMSSRVPYLSLSPVDVSAVSLSPTTKTSPLQSRSVCVGIGVNAREMNAFDLITNITKPYTLFYVSCDLTVFRLAFCSGTPLGLEI